MRVHLGLAHVLVAVQTQELLSAVVEGVEVFLQFVLAGGVVVGLRLEAGGGGLALRQLVDDGFLDLLTGQLVESRLAHLEFINQMELVGHGAEAKVWKVTK